jgi:hypothetical protein
MVVKRRLLLAAACTMVSMTVLTAPMLAASREAQPRPLRAASLLRVKDISANGYTGKGAIVAVGWHEDSDPGQLYLTFSTDGGMDYSKANGRLRRYPVVGEPSLGMSLDICASRVWAATAYHAASDRAGDSDVFLTTRTIGGGAAQALMTSTADNRKVRNVSVACIGNRYVAIAWLEKRGTSQRGRLMVRSVDPLGTTPAYKRIFKLGGADFRGGLDLTATPQGATVAFIRNGDLEVKRVEVSQDAPPTVAVQPLQTLARADVRFPTIDAHGARVVVSYTDAGKVKVRTSSNRGATFAASQRLAPTGGIKHPSTTQSSTVSGDRIVVEARVYSKATGKTTPTRIESTDGGASWVRRTFGNRGARVADLLNRKGQAPLMVEAWHNNAPAGIADTLRARYELPS